MHPNKSLSLSLLSPTAPALQVGEPEGSLPLMARFSSPWSQALLQAPCTGDKQPQTVSCCCLCTGTTCVWCVHCWEHWGETGGGFFCNMLTLSSGHGSLHMEQHAIPEKHHAEVTKHCNVTKHPMPNSHRIITSLYIQNSQRQLVPCITTCTSLAMYPGSTRLNDLLHVSCNRLLTRTMLLSLSTPTLCCSYVSSGASLLESVKVEHSLPC